MILNTILTDRKALRAAAKAGNIHQPRPKPQPKPKPPPKVRKPPTLERETQSGGILYENPEGVPANRLRDANRAWRDLIHIISPMSDGEADDILAPLGVVRTPTSNGWRYTLI